MEILRRPVPPVAFLLLPLLLLPTGCTFFAPDLPGRLPVHHVRASEGPFRAGAGTALITPELPVEMAGYSVFRDATGIHDDLEARALVLERGETSVLLVTVDLIGVQRGDLDRVLEGVDRGAFDRVILHATHDHAGPDTLGLWGTPPFWSGIDEAVMDRVRDGIARAVDRALADRRDAEAGWARTTVPAAGLAWNLRRPGLVDPGMPVLHLREVGGGETIATLVEYGVHPEVLGPENTLLTADFPRWMRARIEEALGGTALFCAGALGGLVTPDRDEEGDPWTEVVRIGETLGDHALEAVASIDAYDDAPLLQAIWTDVALPVENPVYHWAHLVGLFDRILYDGRWILVEVSLLRVGDLVWAGVPGEITPDLGLAIQRTLPGVVPGLVGLTNDEIGYLLPADEQETALFAYERTLTPSLGAGDAVVRHAQALADLMAAGARPRPLHRRGEGPAEGD